MLAIAALVSPPALGMLPLIHLPLETKGLMLPGEARRLRIDSAESLAAIEASQQAADRSSCSYVGSLITTLHGNALAITTLLEIREVRKRAVGIDIEVLAVGRVRLKEITHGRFFQAESVVPAFDTPPGPDVKELVSEVRTAAAHHELMRTRLRSNIDEDAQDEIDARLPAGWSWTDASGAIDEPTAPPLLPLDEARTRMREELCVVSLDREPAASLERIFDLWQVQDDQEAERQIVSFAACTSFTANQRSLALGMLDTEERLQYAQRCLEREANRMAAKAAIHNAML